LAANVTARILSTCPAPRPKELERRKASHFLVPRSDTTPMHARLLDSFSGTREASRFRFYFFSTLPRSSLYLVCYIIFFEGWGKTGTDWLFEFSGEGGQHLFLTKQPSYSQWLKDGSSVISLFEISERGATHSPRACKTSGEHIGNNVIVLIDVRGRVFYGVYTSREKPTTCSHIFWDAVYC